MIFNILFTARWSKISSYVTYIRGSTVAHVAFVFVFNGWKNCKFSSVANNFNHFCQHRVSLGLLFNPLGSPWPPFLIPWGHFGPRWTQLCRSRAASLLLWSVFWSSRASAVREFGLRGAIFLSLACTKNSSNPCVEWVFRVTWLLLIQTSPSHIRFLNLSCVKVVFWFVLQEEVSHSWRIRGRKHSPITGRIISG